MQKDVDLSKFTTLRTGGVAQYFFAVDSVAELQKAVLFAKKENLPVFVLGRGSNVLISDERFEGVVIKNELKGIIFESEESGSVKVIAMAGEDWDGFVQKTVSQKLHGLENLSFIPGTVGASPVQNIGAYGTDVSQSILYVEVLDKTTEKIKKLSNKECKFAYRESIFKTNEGKNFIILSVCFLLSKEIKLQTDYKDLKKYLQEKNIPSPAISDVRNGIIAIRKNKLPSVVDVGTVGSFFKNPIVSIEKKDDLIKKYKDLRWYKSDGGNVKLSGAWLIEYVAGLKGYFNGFVGMHDKQALVLINKGSNNATDINEFAKEIEEKIKKETGVVLQREVNQIGEFHKIKNPPNEKTKKWI